jgi:hypothetical protein
MRVSFVLRSAEESSETLMHCGQVKNRNVIIPQIPSITHHCMSEHNILLRAIGFMESNPICGLYCCSKDAQFKNRNDGHKLKPNRQGSECWSSSEED